MHKRLPVLAFFLILWAGQSSVTAQDARFSQYFNNQPFLHPALAGNGIEHIRVTGIYRTQWAGLGTPFTTQGISVDKVVNRVGIGLSVARHGAGETSVRNMNVLGNLAYHLPLGFNKNNTVSGGVQVGIFNKSFDPNKLSFDNQYSPDQGYDPGASSGEVFSSTSITRPDVNAGLMWQRGWMKNHLRFKPFAGVAFSHLTRPVTTFIDDDTRIPIKQTIYGGAGLMMNDHAEFRPSVMHLTQGTFNEFTFGSMVNMKLDNKNQLQLGVYHRMDDAIIAYAGYQMNQVSVGMSYDINTSELSTTGKGTNAFEISISYSPRPKRLKELEDVMGGNLKGKTTESIAILPVDLIMLSYEKNVISRQDHVVAENVPVIAQNQDKTESVKTASNVNPATETKETQVASGTSVAKTDKLNTVAENKTVPATKADKPVVTEKPTTVPSVTIENQQTKDDSSIPTAVLKTPTVTSAVSSVASNTTVDTDKDGIPDSEDDCPYIKGSKGVKGCPDSDGDGIIDMNDDCPLEAGPATNRGCPDPNKNMPALNQEVVKSYNHILFATGSTRMTTDDIFDIIERSIDVLYADKNVSVLLTGHTDSEGDEMSNMNLSQARADKVKQYLIRQGIDESRIQTLAYGETMPLRDNNSPAAKKQNRRVELHLVKQK
jgi:type IX secretion system PorP/SprF family membrane protein